MGHVPDTGACDAQLRAALEGDPGTASGRAAVLAALVDARVFAPVTATSTGEHPDAGTGLPAEAGAELAVVLLAAADGSRALPVFSDLLELRRWRSDVRPVALTGRQACASAIEQDAACLVVDAGGASLDLTPHEVHALAGGWVPVPGSSLASRRTTASLTEPDAVPERLRAALRKAVRSEHLLAARLLAGPDGPVLGIAARYALEPAEMAALAARLRQRLGSELPTGGLDLALIPVNGPGLDLLGGRWFRRRVR